MTELEWCRENAPDSLKNADDETLLSVMHEVYLEMAKHAEADTPEVNPINYNLDELVIRLCEEFDNLVFHGGYVLNKMMPECSRQTTDIDFNIPSLDMQDKLYRCLTDISEEFKSKGVIDEYKFTGQLNELTCSGINMYKDGKRCFSVDIGIRREMGAETLKVEFGEITVFPKERMLGDKLRAVLSARRLRRPKDLYDIFILSNSFDFSISSILEYINAEGITEWENYPFTDEEKASFRHAYDRLQVRSIYVDKMLTKPSFDKVMERFDVFYASCKTCKDNMYWNHEYKYVEVR